MRARTLAAGALAVLALAGTGATAASAKQPPPGGCTLVWQDVEVAPGVVVKVPSHYVC
jgi:hypothetical protein